VEWVTIGRLPIAHMSYSMLAPMLAADQTLISVCDFAAKQ
jgi:hypothetical protein